jgi:hypothetical protein
MMAFQMQEGHEICLFAVYLQARQPRARALVFAPAFSRAHATRAHLTRPDPGLSRLSHPPPPPLRAQEYGSDCPLPNKNRLYISYLDSVRLLRATPAEGARTLVYHAILQGYMQACADNGIERAHIWVAPPQAGDDYIFHAKPRDQQHLRPMTCAKLRQWYEAMLAKCAAEATGCVTEVKELYEDVAAMESVRAFPVFEGDYWTDKIKQLASQEAQAQGKAPSTTKQQPDADRDATLGGGKGGGKGKGAAAPAANGAAADAERDADEPLQPPQLGRHNSSRLVSEMHKQLKKQRKQFIVATLASKAPRPPPPSPSAHAWRANTLVDSRSAFLSHCQTNHWQFNSYKHAKHATTVSGRATRARASPRAPPPRRAARRALASASHMRMAAPCRRSPRPAARSDPLSLSLSLARLRPPARPGALLQILLWHLHNSTRYAATPAELAVDPALQPPGESSQRDKLDTPRPAKSDSQGDGGDDDDDEREAMDEDGDPRDDERRADDAIGAGGDDAEGDGVASERDHGGGRAAAPSSEPRDCVARDEDVIHVNGANSDGDDADILFAEAS